MPEDQFQQGLDAFDSNDIPQLVASLDALRRINALPWRQDRLKGLLFLKNGIYDLSAKALCSSFYANPAPQVLYEFFLAIGQAPTTFSPQELSKHLHAGIDVIRQCRERNIEPECTAHLEWSLGYILYLSSFSLTELKTISNKWRESLPEGKYDQKSFELFRDIPMKTMRKGKRFFPFVMALAGMENDVIAANTIVAGLPGELNLPRADDQHPAAEYSTDLSFLRTAETFVSAVGEILPIERMLDLGCGPGAVGRMLRPNVEHLTGVDLNVEYLAYAKDDAGYDVTVESEVIEFLTTSQGQFDLITACMLLDYLPGKEVIRLAVERLAPGGFLAFTFIPSHLETVGNSECHQYYRPDFFADVAPSLTTVSCDMHTYMWTGGYYVVLQRQMD